MTEHGHSPTQDRDKSGIPIWLIVAGVLLVLGAVFVLQNTENITMEFLWFELNLPLWVTLIIFFGLGFVLAEGWSYMRRRRRRAGYVD